ncbi:MAG: hypothetical protein C0404_08045 [Verrucomicrobia bacterium]|nr:hypothetical protein [Verrucomicrobiota bacterium]
MNMIETPVSFESSGRILRGILHLPGTPAGAPLTCVVFLNGWPGSRIGPHRMFVTAARQLTADGFCCLRFDFGGRGESDGLAAEATIRSMVADTRCAINSLVAQANISRVVLLGICSGAKVAIAEAADDARVQALVLWSPEAMGHLRSPATKAARSASMAMEYIHKLSKPGTWKKILTFDVNTRMVQKALVGPAEPTEEETREESQTLQRFGSFRGSVILLYGGSDGQTRLAAANYREFFETRRLKCEVHEIPHANHNFYSLAWEKTVIDATRKWLLNLGNCAT